jgi:hypothetical protein
LKTLVAGVSDFGVLAVAGSATLGGTLVVHPIESFKGSLGQKLSVLSTAALTGTFAFETEDQINSTGLYYMPTYSSTTVTLVVTQATQTPSPTSGLPGSSVTVSGSGYLPGDTLTVRFTDRKGVQTFYPTVTVNGSGEFSTEIAVPAGAVTGAAQINVTSAETGVHINKSFTVA